jgi:hypothetical protein
MLRDNNNNPVVTEDGVIIRVNPRTSQLTNPYGYALFNRTNGLPIIYHDNDIITTDGKQQTITNGKLVDALTIQHLLDTGTDFYFDTITCAYGTYDVPVFKYNGNWALLDGTKSEGITNGVQDWWESDDNGIGFGEWFNDTFGGLGDGLDKIIQIVGLVLVGVVLILLFPLITLIISVIIFPLKMLVSALKKRGKHDENN